MKDKIDSIKIKINRQIRLGFNRTEIKEIDSNELKSKSCFDISRKYGMKDTGTAVSLKLKYS